MSVRQHLALALLWLGQSLYGQLYFPGGDRLSGTLQSLDTATEKLGWAYPGAGAPFDFKTSRLDQVLLEHEAKVPGKFRLTLAQGDVLQGQLVDIDETTVTFDPGFAEPFVLAKTAIHRIDRDWDRSKVIYSGPNAANEWRVGYRGTNWKFEPNKKALICSSYSSTGREFEKMPTIARFEVQLTLENEPIAHVFLGAENPRNGGDNYYYLKLTPNVIDFERRLKDHPRTYITLPKEDGPADAQALFQGKTELHLAVEIDQTSKRLKVFFDGELYATYRDPSPQAPQGSSILLTSYGSGSLEARDIRLYALDRLTVHDHVVPPGNALLDTGETLSTEVLTKHQLGSLLAVRMQLLAGEATTNATRCLLANGTQLTGPMRLEEDGELAIQHPILGARALPLAWVDRLSFPPAPPLASPNRVLFKNGDQLGGTPHSWDETKGLQWSLPGHANLLQFPPRALAEMRLQPQIETSTSPALLRLVGGDLLPGQVTKMTAETLTLETHFSDPMALPAPAIQRIDFVQSEHLYASGPETPIERWTKNGLSADWQFVEDDALIGKGLGGIGQAVPMPERGRLDLEVSWKGFLDASITIFARNLSRSSQPKSYRFHCEGERITLYRGLTAQEIALDEKEDDPLRNRRLEEQLERFSAQFGGGAARKLGSPVAVDFQRHERVRQLSVCWDNATAEISLVLDGAVLRTWKDPAGLVPPSAGLIFQQHKPSTILRVHRFTVEEWNGVLPDPPLTTEELETLANTRLRLRNQDEFNAATLSLKAADAPLNLGSDLGPLAIPLDRLHWIQYPERKFPIEFEKGMAVKAEFATSGSCRFFLIKLEDGRLHVRSPYFGENVFQMGAIKGLTFDLQDFDYWRHRKR